MEHHPAGGDVGDVPGLGQEGRLPGDLPGVERPGVHAVVQDLAAQNGLQTQNRADQGAFSAAVGAHQDQHLAGLKADGDILHHRPGPVARREMADFNHECAPLSAGTAAR